MGGKVTLKDVARETGVHVSTVSRALDPATSDSLSAEVVGRVRAAAERLGYRRNNLARSLRTRRTMTVGVTLPDITNTLYAPMVRGADGVLEQAGYASIIVSTDDDPKRKEKMLDILLERGVDGILDIGALRDDPQILKAVYEGVPVVTANREVEGSSIPCVLSDDAEGIRLVFELLESKGHVAIAHLGGPDHISTGWLRREVFRRNLENRGGPITGAEIVPAHRFDEDEGYRCAVELLESRPGFTALVCANDRLALGAIQAFKDKGLSCPGDISVTGFNDLPFLHLIPPGLTTIRVQHFNVGRFGAELLLKMMTDPEAPIPRRTILPVTLVERGSVGPATG